jgi:hypothetical protein
MDWRRISVHAIRSGEFVIEKAQMFDETLYFPQRLGRLLSVTETADDARQVCVKEFTGPGALLAAQEWASGERGRRA